MPGRGRGWNVSTRRRGVVSKSVMPLKKSSSQQMLFAWTVPIQPGVVLIFRWNSSLAVLRQTVLRHPTVLYSFDMCSAVKHGTVASRWTEWIHWYLFMTSSKQLFDHSRFPDIASYHWMVCGFSRFARFVRLDIDSASGVPAMCVRTSSHVIWPNAASLSTASSWWFPNTIVSRRRRDWADWQPKTRQKEKKYRAMSESCNCSVLSSFFFFLVLSTACMSVCFIVMQVLMLNFFFFLQSDCQTKKKIFMCLIFTIRSHC